MVVIARMKGFQPRDQRYRLLCCLYNVWVCTDIILLVTITVKLRSAKVISSLVSRLLVDIEYCSMLVK